MFKKLKQLLPGLARTSTAGSGRHQRRRRPSRPALENLEDRLVPTTTLFIDFGLALPAAGLPLSVNAPLVGPSLRDLVGPNTGPDLTSGKVTLPAVADLNLKPVST